VQGFWLLAGENGTFKPQMRNSDTETSSETIATRKMKPAVKGVDVKRSSQSEARWLRAPMNKRPFHEDDALGTVLVGGGGQKSKNRQKIRWLDISGQGDSKGCQSSQLR